MGREWLIRKEMILAIIQYSLGNIDLCLKIMKNIEVKHKDMLQAEQYSMVIHFINAIRHFIKKPHESDENLLNEIEKKINLKKERVFRDPRLIIFYAWMRSKYVKRDPYEILLEEYQKMK